MKFRKQNIIIFKSVILHELKVILLESNLSLPLQSFEFVEIWAGKAMVSSVMERAGKGTASLDIEYWKEDPKNIHRTNHFDILTDSGLGFHCGN